MSGHSTETAAGTGGLVRPIEGGITAPEGFAAAAAACGIKKAGLDLALVVASGRASAAGLFTTNRAQAAPVLVSRDHLTRTGGRARAVVVNSGCANACTGDAGLEVARAMAAGTARAIGCAVEEVLVASTGVIGVQLDEGRVARGIETAATSLGRAAHGDAARAIMTTDPWPKERAVEAVVAGRRFRVGGIAKGSGMIEPRLATMLAFLTTDARVEPAPLRAALAAAAADTFNAITVDGECSTNDCVIALAGGESGVDIGNRELPVFTGALREVCRELAIEIVRGGEGATKLVAIHVTGAASEADARQAARTIANSPLVKTAVHGGDPNWGRLIAAAGRAGVPFVLDRAAVRIGPVVLFENGRPHDERAPEAATLLRERRIAIEVDLGAGGGHDATMWTCDFSAEYVRINADYRT
jgi:glutamate N-acetyltransferase/amino-acid N-acetyltransferase